MANKSSKRFGSLWKRESDDKDALFVDISVDPNSFPLKTLYDVSNAEKSPIKDNKLSLSFRTKGNDAFGRKHWHEAMKLYNKSLCFAEMGTENVSLAFGNRSACFFSLKMYSKSLIDIELAMKANYPDRLMEKLEKRKSDCLRLIEAGDEFVAFVPKLSFEPNEMFPSMANTLKIESNKIFGRYISATSDIGVGETIMIEKAYVNKVITDRQLRCNICYRFQTNLVPCSVCVKDMFCYDGCQHNSFHNIECNLKTMDRFDNVSSFHLKIMRSILMAIKTMPNIEELMTFVEKTIASDPLEIPESEPIDCLSKYRTFLKLHINSRMETDKFNWRVYFINKTLINHPDIQAMFTSIKHQRFLLHLIGHHSGIIHYNARASIQIVGTEYTTELQPLIAAYFNHSCAPNVATVTSDDLITAIAVRPIKKGEQLFISYFGRDLHRGTDGRRRHFDEFFDFVCKCERCMSREPQFVPFQNSYDLELIQTVVTDCYNNKNFDFDNRAKVKYFLERCSAYSRENSHKVWTDEVSLVMHCFIHMLDYQLKHKLTF